MFGDILLTATDYLCDATSYDVKLDHGSLTNFSKINDGARAVYNISSKDANLHFILILIIFSNNCFFFFNFGRTFYLDRYFW